MQALSNERTITAIPAGATITRTYWAIPTFCTSGEEFDDRDTAVLEVQRQHATRITDLRENLGSHSTDEEIHAAANRSVVLDLRWTIQYPSANGIITDDLVAQRFSDVAALRTTASTQR